MVANLNVRDYTFQAVNDFKYLGTNINKNNMHNEILRISAANKGFFALVKLFKSTLLSKRSKFNLYMSYLCPVFAYGCETWSVTKRDKDKLLIFEKKVLRQIYGPIYEYREYRIKTNEEIYQLFQKLNINTFIRSKWLEWAGHLREYVNKFWWAEDPEAALGIDGHFKFRSGKDCTKNRASRNWK